MAYGTQYIPRETERDALARLDSLEMPARHVTVAGRGALARRMHRLARHHREAIIAERVARHSITRR